MNAALPQIQSKLAEASALRADALDTLRSLALGRMEADHETRVALVSKFDGYEREFWALVKFERELVAYGRISLSNPPLKETRFDAPGADSAVLTPSVPESAPEVPREAPRDEMAEKHGISFSSTPIFSASDCF